MQAYCHGYSNIVSVTVYEMFILKQGILSEWITSSV
jgi:hypothetical protein